SMQAMLTGKADTPALQAQKSSISAQGAKQKAGTRQDLTRVGLDKSSAGIAAEEDIDRAISQLLSGAETAATQDLINFGRSAAFSQSQQATNILGGLAPGQ